MPEPSQVCQLAAKVCLITRRLPRSPSGGFVTPVIKVRFSGAKRPHARDRFSGDLFCAYFANSRVANYAAERVCQVLPHQVHAAVGASDLFECTQRPPLYARIIVEKAELAQDYASSIRIFVAAAEEQAPVDRGRPIYVFA